MKRRSIRRIVESDDYESPRRYPDEDLIGRPYQDIGRWLKELGRVGKMGQEIKDALYKAQSRAQGMRSNEAYSLISSLMGIVDLSKMLRDKEDLYQDLFGAMRHSSDMQGMIPKDWRPD